MFRLLATLTLFTHAVWIVWMLGGVFLIRSRLRLGVIYFISVLATLLFAFTRGICPLTDMESYFREKAGVQRYDTGFIEHYLSEFVYLGDHVETLAGLQMILLVLTALAILINFGRKLRF